MHPLNKNEVINKRKAFGSNEITEQEKNKLLLFFKEIISEPMFILLIACALIYTLIGDKLEGMILIFSVSIIIMITFFQHQRSEKALKALKKLSSPSSTVLREEEGIIKINSKEVVVDDILLLFEGDYVSADAIILETEHLIVNESALTGESFPVLKSSIADSKNNIIFSGSYIIHGNAKAIVTSVGNTTQIGKTGKSLTTIKQEKSRLQKEMKVLVRNLFIAGILLSIIVIIVFYITKGNLLYATLAGLSSAMAILPEEFPVVLTVFLTMGAWKLAKLNVLIRNPASVENLGATTFLCTDKTGTITENKMEIASCTINDELINKIDFKNESTKLKEFFSAAFFACPEITNDPMDKAIKEVHSGLFGKNYENILIKEFTFNKDDLSVTRILKKEKCIAYAKGAPEKIIERCNLNNNEKQKQIDILNGLSKNGLRIIGIAKSNVDENNIHIQQEDFKLNFLGWMAFEDPIRKGIKEAVQLCKSAGIKVMLITGDYKETAIEICKQASIFSNGKNYSGEELDALSDNELEKNIQETELFYRVKPLQKLRIVNALKNKHEVVCMTGDGINDAPALKAADIGVAMGLKGTSVAKEASSIILLDDNFNSIVNGIKTGRKIYVNIKHAFSYIISIHVPIVGLAILPAFVTDFPVLLMPVHIVLLELMIDPISSITFEKFDEDLNIMQKPPRTLNENFFNKTQWLKSGTEGLIFFTILIFVLLISRTHHQNEGQQRAVVLITFVLGNLLLVINKLEKSKKRISENNSVKTVIVTSTIISGVLSAIIFIPFLRTLFRLELIDKYLWYVIFLFLFFLIIILNLIKQTKKFTTKMV